MRIFVAAELSGDVRQTAAARMTEIRRAIASRAFAGDIRWVPEENLHLTIWFLGHVADARVPDVLEALRPPLAAPAN